MKHYIITLYNVKFKNLFTYPRFFKQKTMGEYFDNLSIDKRSTIDWLSFRANLFKTFTYPSIVNQTNQNFTWLILFDENTPKEYITSLGTRFVPLLVNGDNIHEKVKDIIKFNNWVLSTNLDSDDALSINFIEELQKTSLEEKIIVSGSGFRLRRPENVVLHIKNLTKKVNHFHSVLSRTDLCIDKSHGEFAINKQVLKKVYWLELIHSDNLSNRLNILKGSQLQPFKEYASLFGLNSKNFPCAFKENCKGNIDPRVLK